MDKRGNLLIIQSDEEDDNKVKDEKTADRDSVLSDSIRSNPGSIDNSLRQNSNANTNEATEKRDSALPDSPRDSYSDQSVDKRVDLADTLIGIQPISLDTEVNKSDFTNGASGQSDEFSSIDFGVDIKDDTQKPDNSQENNKESNTHKDKSRDEEGEILVVEEGVNTTKDKDLIHNILASLPPEDQSLASMDSLTGGAFDPILSHKLSLREKQAKQKVPVPSVTPKRENALKEKIQTIEKGQNVNTGVVENDKSDNTEKDPATLSGKDKLSKFKKAPVPAPRSRKTPDIQSSTKARQSLFEKDKETEFKKAPVPAPRPIKPPDNQSSMKARQSLFEKDKETDKKGGEVLKPKKRSEISSSFRASLNFAEQTSKPEKGKTDIERPMRRSDLNPSFRAAKDLAEKQASYPGVESKTFKEEASSSQIRRKPQPQSRNPSFKAAHEAISIANLQPFAGARPKRLQGLSEETRSNTLTKIRPKVTQETEKRRKDYFMAVSAMDFGTTNSAIAFSFINDCDKILTYKDAKIPTVILMDPDQNVHSFGDEAKTEFYNKFDDKNTYKQWYYFECFKMKLYVTDTYFDKTIDLEDYSGKKMKALGVFSKAIEYLRKQLIEFLNEHTTGVRIDPDKDIHWVLTVPAIWPDLSKAFMREAAEKAGIPTDLLSLALEPEAASLSCRKYFGVHLRGKKFIVLDLGGGTADYVCHELLPDDKIKESHMATGGEFGGKSVDNELFKLFVQIYGGDVMGEFKKTKDYKDFCDNFERKKRKFDGSKDFTFKISASTLNAIFERKVGEPASRTINQSPLKDKVSWKFDKIIIKRDLAVSIFDKAVSKIVETTKTIMAKVQDIDHIIMVGGFSCSKYITEIMKQVFPLEGFVITPEDPQLAVVKGAVTFGQDTTAIVSRISKYTYGIGRAMIYKKGDPEDRTFIANGARWCEDCFCKHIEIGQEIGTDDEVEAIDYYPPDANVRNYCLEVFASIKKDPRYTYENGCYSIGILRLEVDTQGDVWSKIEVKLIYKGTELELQAYDVKNRKLTTGKVEFWG